MDKIPWKSYINEGKIPWKSYICMKKRKKRALVLCNDNLRVVDRIIYLPIYMLMFISKVKSPQPLIYKIDTEGLV